MSDNNTSGGIGFCGLLTILFIALKLTGYIVWSWWWVLSPLWIPFCLVLGMVLGAIVAMVVAGLLSLAGISIFENRQKITDTLKRWFLKEKNGNS